MEKQAQKKPEFKYREQHAVVVKVQTEEEQKKAYEALLQLGFKDIKVVSV